MQDKAWITGLTIFSLGIISIVLIFLTMIISTSEW